MILLFAVRNRENTLGGPSQLVTTMQLKQASLACTNNNFLLFTLLVHIVFTNVLWSLDNA